MIKRFLQLYEYIFETLCPIRFGQLRKMILELKMESMDSYGVNMESVRETKRSYANQDCTLDGLVGDNSFFLCQYIIFGIVLMMIMPIIALRITPNTYYPF